MGLFGGSKTTSNSTTNSTNSSLASFNKSTTPDLPDWMRTQMEGIGTNIYNLGQKDPLSYVAGPSALQTQAAAGASSLGGNSDWYTKLMGGSAPTVAGSQVAGGSKIGAQSVGGSQASASSMTAASLLDGGLGQYFNPYISSVHDATMADLDFNAGRDRAQEDLNIASDAGNGFNGSGSAITRSLSEEARARTRNTASADLYKGGFDTAANLANLDADRRQEAAATNAKFSQDASSQNANLAQELGFKNADLTQTADTENARLAQELGIKNADLSQAAGIKNADLSQGWSDFLGKLGLDKTASDRENVKTQGDVGATMQTLAQNAAGAPLDLAKWVSETYGGAGLQNLIGSHDTGTTNTSGTSYGTTNGTNKVTNDFNLMDAAKIAAMFFV